MLVLHRSMITHTLVCGNSPFSTASFHQLMEECKKKKKIAGYNMAEPVRIFFSPQSLSDICKKGILPCAGTIFYHMDAHTRYDGVKLHRHYIFSGFYGFTEMLLGDQP